MSRLASFPAATERLPRNLRTAAMTLGLLVGLALVFLLLPFKLAYSSTAANITYTSGESNREAKSETGPQQVAVWIEEKDRLSTLLRDRLVTELEASGRYIPHIVESAKPGANDLPLLRVWIARPGLSWTPVYAQMRAEVRFGFSNFTQVVLDRQETFIFNGPPGQYQYTSRGTLNLEDHTYGLVSLPGYWSWVADKAAREIVAKLP